MDMSGWNVYLPLFCPGYFWQNWSESARNGIENIIKSTSGASIAIPGTLALIAAVVSIVVKE